MGPRACTQPHCLYRGAFYVYLYFQRIHNHTLHQDRQYERSVQRTEFGNENLNTSLHFANTKYVKNHKEISVYNPHYTKKLNQSHYRPGVAQRVPGN